MRQLRLFVAGVAGVLIASGCQCGDSLSQLPMPAAVLVHDGDETPPADHLVVDIGVIEIDTRVETVFTLRNDGTRDLEIRGMQFNSDPLLCPTASGAFQLEPLTGVVAAGSGRNFLVAYTPSTGDTGCTVLEVATDDRSHPWLRAVLSGRG